MYLENETTLDHPAYQNCHDNKHATEITCPTQAGSLRINVGPCRT